MGPRLTALRLPRRAFVLVPFFWGARYQGCAEHECDLMVLRGERFGATAEEDIHMENTAPYMGIISWIILGLIAGFIGSKIVNRTGEGIVLDVVLGVVGAVIGGYVFSLFGAEGVTGLNLWSLLVAVIGAVVVLLVYRLIVGGGSFAGPRSL